MTTLTEETIARVLASAKLGLGIPAADTSRDAELTAQISRANTYVEQYLGFPVEPAEFTETVVIDNWPQRGSILLPFKRLDVDSVSSVEADGQPLDVDAGIWSFDSACSALVFHGYYSAQQITVTYEAGGDQVADLLIEAMANFTVSLAVRAAGSGTVPVPAGMGSLVSLDIPGIYRATFRAPSDSGFLSAIVPVEVASILDLYRARGV